MPKFHKKSVERQAQLYIKWYGQDYEFIRFGKNEFGEVLAKPKQVIKLRGIFHDGGRKLDLYRVLNMTTHGTYLSESMPQVFCLWENAEKLKYNDYLIMNGEEYIITGIYNVHEMNTLCEISLEHVQNSQRQVQENVI